MQADDVIRVLQVSPYHEFAVAIEPAGEFPGYVRSIYLRMPARVSIEYEVHGLDEGGAYFEAAYPSIERAIEALEDFQSRPVAEWRDLNETGDYPQDADRHRLNEGHLQLQQAIANGSVPLPRGAQFVLRGSYWKQFEAKG